GAGHPRDPSPARFASSAGPARSVWSCSSSTLRLRPRCERGAVTTDYLLRERQVALRALRLDVVEEGGKPVARRLGKAHVARHDRLVDLAGEIGADVVHHLPGEVVAGVEHGEDDTVEGEVA